jgi:hypothetical protein
MYPIVGNRFSGIPQEDILELELKMVPGRHRDDAVQEVWLSHLEGRDPVATIRTFASSQYRHDTSHVSIESDDGVDFARDIDGKIHVLTSKTPAPRQSNSKRPSQHSRKLAG